MGPTQYNPDTKPDTDTTKVQAPTLAQLLASKRGAATERELRKRSDADRRRLDIINGKRRGRL
jgi:hypothetical protein